MNLITIISRNLAHLTPIIFEFKDKVKNHFLIYDIDEVELAEQLKKGIEFLNNKYNLKSNIYLFQLDEDNNNNFKDNFQKIKQVSIKNLYLNVTEADTTITVLFSAFVLKNGGKVISYDTFDNSYNLLTKNKLVNKIIMNNMKIDDFMGLLDYKIELKKGFKELKSNKKFVLELFKNFDIFFKIRKFLLEDKIYKLTFSEKKLLKSLDVLDESDNIKDITKITGILFEEFIFWKLYELDVDDIFASVNLKTKNNVKNEFDVLMIKDNHIYTIECKLGKNLKGDNVIYKSDSLLELFGDDSKNLIVNISTKEITNITECIDISETFTYSANMRAKANNIAIYHKKRFKNKSFYKKVNKFFNLRKRVFLLGGKDLEMVTIKSLLKSYDIKFYDKKLKWDNANLSEYKDVLNDKEHFYGIELNEDIKPPKYYTKIDHHNELSTNKCSLAQVADILNLKLLRRGELICANDSGYIPAMKKLGATKEEIKKIRKEDRKCQGVTEQDELLAKKSIKENLKIINEIKIVYSFTDKFSAIVDNLEYKNLIIYNDTKLVFYGINAHSIAKENKNLIKEGLAYYGGDENYGFFGIVDSKFSKKEIEDFIEKYTK
jgi:hypothetical protein